MGSRRDDLVWPERQRCLACRGPLGSTVVHGRYCSWGCAGMPAPSQDPDDWPRQHYHVFHGRREEKAAYRSAGDARAAMLVRGPEGRHLQTYLCDYCGMWHLGKTRLSRG